MCEFEWLEFKWRLTILLYSSSSISFTFRQYDWNTQGIHALLSSEQLSGIVPYIGLKWPVSCRLTRYSNFTSRYLRMVSFVSGMALLRYVFRSWSIWTTRCTGIYKIQQKEKMQWLYSNPHSRAWRSLAAECRISQCCGEHRQTSQKPHWLQPAALARRWQKKHPQMLEG